MNKLTTLILFFISISLTAQDAMRVERGNAVSRSLPVLNIFVDADNNKFVGNVKGVYQVHSINQSTPLDIPSGSVSLLQFRGGNFDYRMTEADLQQYISDYGGDNRITAAHYDSKKKEVWIGTADWGLYHFKAEPFQLIKHYSTETSRIESDFINFIYIDISNRVWVGTEEGMFSGKDGKWKTQFEEESFMGIFPGQGFMWVIGEESLSQVDSKMKWVDVPVKGSQKAGIMVDVAVDSKDRLWIASEIITRFDEETERVDPYAAPELYTSENASFITIDHEDAIWVATKDKGLFIIEKDDAMTVTCLVDKEVSCDAFSGDGALKVLVEGGKAPYTYKWNKGLKGENPGDLEPGEYSVTVTDSRGKSKSAGAVINSPGILLEVTMEQIESADGANDGIASVKVIGGRPEYTYQWDNGETKSTAVKLSAGKHTVSVSDKAGCKNSATVEISQEEAPLVVELEQTGTINCTGERAGAIAAAVKGGTGPYQYQWNKSGASGNSLSGLAAGTYRITVSDSNNNKATEEFTIAEPENLTANILVQTPASTGNADGKAEVQIKGGTSPYVCSWDNGETTQTASKLAPGLRSVTITDASGCTTTSNVNMDENVLPLQITVSATSEIKCTGALSGALKVVVTGGKPPFSYEWDNNKIKGDNPTKLPAGKYEVVVKDATGKYNKQKIELEEPKALEAEVSVQSPASTGNADGKAVVKVNGGSGKYTFKWDNGEGSGTASKLGPGNHTVTITDGNGCSTVSSTSIEENILALSVSVKEEKSIACAGESSASLKVEVSGGKGPYEYIWNNELSGENPKGVGAGSYEVEVKDASGKSSKSKIKIEEPKELSASVDVIAPASTGNADGKAEVKVSGGTGKYSYKWDTGESTTTASNLGPGDHQVTITDENGCTTFATTTIQENILALAVSLDQKETIQCAGGASASIEVKVNGGKGPFQYKWNVPELSGEKASNLKAGTYKVTVLDASGKVSESTLKVEEPSPLKTDINVVAPASTGNADGQAKVNVSGGSGSYTFKWDNGETAGTASKLAPGNHSVIITDANGCTTTANIDILENVLPLSLNITQTGTIKCHGDQTGALALELSGGKPPFDYKWNNPSLNGDKGTNLSGGNYEVTVTDATGTSKSATIKIDEPEPLNASIAKKRSTTTEVSKDGYAKVAVSGGAGQYTFLWDTGATGEETNDLAEGKHTVNVKDANGCSVELALETKKKIIPKLTAKDIRMGQTIRLEKIIL